jgi:hypothetical protein
MKETRRGMKRAGNDSVIIIASTAGAILTAAAFFALLQLQLETPTAFTVAAAAAFVAPVRVLHPQRQRQRGPPEPIVLISRSAFLSSDTAAICSTANTSTILIPSEWKPRSRYWIDHDIQGLSRSELADQMGVDIQQEDPSSKHSATTSTDRLEQQQQLQLPSVKMLHKNKLGQVIAVEISSAISESQAQRIQTMAASIRQNHHEKTPRTITLNNRLFQHRSFGEEKGGNDCTYLAPLLQLLTPEIAQTVVSIARLAWEEAGWNLEQHKCKDDPTLTSRYPNPMDLGIRTSEHLSYDGWRSLEAHKDVGSIYTCNVAFKEPDIDYQGGDFFLQTSFLEQVEIKPERLSAIVFLSDTTHGVRPITFGSRMSFVTEFWNHDDAPLGMNRPTPKEWQEFLEKQL